MHHTALSRWIVSLHGPTARHGSPRNLSLAAGLDQNTANNVYVRGKGAPETLIKLADAAGVNRVEVFVMAGWLRPEDVLPGVSGPDARLLLLPSGACRMNAGRRSLKYWKACASLPTSYMKNIR